MTSRPTFFSQLKRRNVLRAAVLYAGAVWAISQGISQLTPALGLPDYATRWFLIAAAIGFPFWVVCAWFYEFTPHGFRRESEVAEDAPLHHSNARRLDFSIIAVLALAVVLLASGYFVQRHGPATLANVPAAASKAVRFDPPRNSLVVLPFANLSGDPKQQYFSDGITEELTDALGQNPGLQVIAWETAARFRNHETEPVAVGRQLNVANILNGSIEREADQVRVTAELVDARSGLQLWSAHYDARFADILKVQDQVSAAIASALKVKFAQADLPAGGTTNPAAHDLVLKGRALMDHFTASSLAGARQYFEQALALDPDYADAHALLSRALLDLTGRSALPLETTLPTIRAEAEKAIKLDPHSADAWLALGNAMVESDPPDLIKARADYQRALAIDPSNAAAHSDLGTLLPLTQALQEDTKAIQIDPANETTLNNLAVNAQDLDDWAQEIQTTEALMKLDPAVVDSAFYLAFAHQQLRQYDQMVAAFDLVKPATPVDQEQVDAGRLTYQALRNRALRPKAIAALKALDDHHSSNQDVAGNLMQLYLALGKVQPALQLLERSCPADPVGCNDLAVSPIYRALHGNPRFDALAKKYTTVTMQ